VLKISVTEVGYHILEILQAGRQMIDTDTDNKINYPLQSLCYRVSQLSCSYTLCIHAENYGTANTIISMSVCTNLSSRDRSFSAALIKASKHTLT